MIKEVNILGKTLKIGYNMGVACDFEIESGEVFDLAQSFKSKNNQALLLWVSLRRMNPDFDMTKDELLDALTFEEYTIADNAIAQCLTDFYKLPSEELSSAKEEGDSKNA